MADPKILHVLLYHQPIGTLTHLSGDKNLFAFDQSYIDNSSRPILSLSFRGSLGNLITDIKATQTRLPPFFSNLLPEGTMREYLAKRANVNPEHEFALLEILGEDLPGAITIQALNKSELSFSSNTATSKSEKKRGGPMRFSLAGVQLKFSAIEQRDHGLLIPANGVGGQWIVKLPNPLFPGVPENEYTMMELARRVGIDVPEIALFPVGELHGIPEGLGRTDNQVFAIKRFDRTENGEKIHIEDFAQVFGVYPEKKYRSASYRNIAEVIAKEVGETGLVEFIKRFVFNALIGNGDMHLKNWSLIYRENKPMLAPAYDFVSTILYLPEDQLALNFVDSKDFRSLTLQQFRRFATKANLPVNLVLETVQKTTQAFAEAWKTAKDLPLKGEIRNAIEQHLRILPFFK